MESNQYLYERIIGRSSHKFIYGYNGEERASFLKKAALAYSINGESNTPIGIYIEGEQLPVPNKSLEREAVVTFSHQCYINLLIILNILNAIIEQGDRQISKDRLKKFFNNLQKVFGLSKDINNLSALRASLKSELDACYNKYVKYINTGNLQEYLAQPTTKYVILDIYLRHFKILLNTDSYFAIIFDQQTMFSTLTQKTINSLIGHRNNSDIAINVACEPNEWETLEGLNNNFINAMHDFDYVKLDACYQETVNGAKRRTLK